MCLCVYIYEKDKKLQAFSCIPFVDIRAHACNICDLPRPGSPINRTCMSLLDWARFALPPNKLKINPALIISWPYMLGHNECTNNAKRFGSLYIFCIKKMHNNVESKINLILYLIKYLYS
jgi:hypothetical protein